VLEICAALELSDLIFVGHSISGIIGLLASIRAPERFERLIMIGPSARYLNDPPDYVGGFERADIVGLLDLMEKNYAGWASYLAPLVMQNAERPDLAHELEASFRVTDPEIARHFAAATFFIDHRADLPAVTVPSLILQCADDMIVPPAAADYLHRHLPASTLWMMDATGHYPHVSYAEETIRLMRKYLVQPLPCN
jgi:sigma-B regulation protein RsbQ